MPDERQPAAPRGTRSTRTPAARAVEEKPFSTIEVRVGRLPGKIENIVLNGGRTVSDALTGAGLGADGHEIRVNGAIQKENFALSNGDTVLLVRKVSGNNTH